jgi:hypothetical protein
MHGIRERRERAHACSWCYGVLCAVLKVVGGRYSHPREVSNQTPYVRFFCSRELAPEPASIQRIPLSSEEMHGTGDLGMRGISTCTC